MPHRSTRDEIEFSAFEEEHRAANAGTSVDAVGFLRRHRRGVVLGTVVTGLLTVGLAAVSLALPGTERIGVIDITPTFPGAGDGKYPNRTQYSPQDIIASHVLEPLWRDQHLEDVVDFAELGRNLQVVAGGSELELMRSEYLQKLSNAKLTTAERISLEAEYSARLKSMKSASLTISLAAAGSMSNAQMTRLLAAIPAEWARGCDAAGTRSYDFPLPLGAELRASGAQLSAGGSVAFAVVHAERMKEFVDSLSVAIDSMSKVSGSEGIKDSGGASIVDLGHELASVRQNLVIPTFIDALRQARASDPDGYSAIRTARGKVLESELQAAKERARVLREAYEAYADETRMVRRPEAATADDSRRTGLTANVDGTFIDRVIEQAVKGRDVEYRRELTDRRLQAELDVVRLSSKVDFEKWLDSSVQDVRTGDSRIGEVSQRMQTITESIAKYGDRAQEIMRSLSQRNLYAASTMFRVDTPPVVRSLPLIPLRVVALCGIAFWAAAMSWVVLRGAMSDRRRMPSMMRLDGATAEEFRRQAVGAIAPDPTARPSPRRLPDDTRQPIG
jgi:hypothetical protein